MKCIKVSLICALCFCLSCASSKTKPTLEQIETLKSMVELRQLRVESTWAIPQTTFAVQQVLNSGLLPPNSSANRIDLIGNSNFLEMSGDSIRSYLPFFGERQFNVGYNGSDSAIQFKGLIEEYEVESTKNGGYLMKFKARSNSEQFNVSLHLTPGLSSTLIMNSGSRLSIKYTGNVKPLEVN